MLHAKHENGEKIVVVHQVDIFAYIKCEYKRKLISGPNWHMSLQKSFPS